MSKTNNERQEAIRGKLSARYQRQYENDLKNVITSDFGRRALMRLIFDICKLQEAGWAMSAEVHYLAGRRRVGEELLSILEEVAPAQTRRMVDEWLTMRYEFRTELDRAFKDRSTGDTEETDDAS